jgi:hypothetical protein
MHTRGLRTLVLVVGVGQGVSEAAKLVHAVLIKSWMSIYEWSDKILRTGKTTRTVREVPAESTHMPCPAYEQQWQEVASELASEPD